MIDHKNNTNDNTKTDALESSGWETYQVWLLAVGAMTIVLLLKCCHEKFERNRRTNSRETTPLLRHKYPEGGQPPSYAELSPSYPSPPTYEELNLVAGEDGKK